MLFIGSTELFVLTPTMSSRLILHARSHDSSPEWKSASGTFFQTPILRGMAATIPETLRQAFHTPVTVAVTRVQFCISIMINAGRLAAARFINPGLMETPVPGLIFIALRVTGWVR